MRRKTIIDGLQKIKADIIRSEVIDVFQTIIHRREEKEASLNILPTFQSLSLAYHNYSSDERHLAVLLDIHRVYTIDFWSPVLEKTGDGVIGHLFPMYSALQHAIAIADRFVSLLKNDRIETVVANDPSAPQILRDKELLTLILPETNEQFSSPARVAFAIEAIDIFYKTYAEIFALDSGDLVILSCDSGSDKSFDFTGIPQIIQAVKDVVFGIWDRVVFHSHSQQQASLKLIAESLPVYEKISHMVDNKSMSPEQGEILRRQVLAAATKFIEAGATIPELDSRAVNSPREIMAPERKLLAGPAQHLSSEKISGEVPPAHSDVLTDEAAMRRRIDELEAQVRRQTQVAKTSRRSTRAKKT